MFEANLGRAMSQTSRVMSRFSTFLTHKYNSLMDYLYERAPRYANKNRVVQAPLDDSMMD